MPENSWMFLVVGLIPLVIGFIWYGKLAFGNKWMKLNGFTEEELQQGNFAVILGVSYLFSVMIAFALSGIVIHQGGVLQTLYPDVMEAGSDAQRMFNEIMAVYGNSYRTFSHGALHGALITFLFIFPVIGINALFERRGWSYILIHTGYWLLTLVLMGGVLCQFLSYGSL